MVTARRPTSRSWRSVRRHTSFSWREASGATVVHVEELANSTLHSIVTLDGQRYRLAGSF